FIPFPLFIHLFETYKPPERAVLQKDRQRHARQHLRPVQDIQQLPIGFLAFVGHKSLMLLQRLDDTRDIPKGYIAHILLVLDSRWASASIRVSGSSSSCPWQRRNGS